jgi:hypothetical protein
VSAPALATAAPSGAAAASRRRAPALLPHVLVVAAAMALWAVSLSQTDPGRMGDLGLVTGLAWTWEAAFALLLGGFVTALVRGDAPRPAAMVLYLGALVLLIHGTAPLLYAEPRYAWTYKHLAVTDLLATRGSVDRSIDIYNNWPGFFAAGAWLQRLSGVPMLQAAAWAMVLFSAATLAAVHYAVTGLTRSPRLAWLATGLFLIGSWVGTEYYSPQAMAFVLAFTLIGLVLRATDPRAVPERVRIIGARAPLRLLARLVARPTGDEAADALLTTRAARLPGRVALAVGAVLWIAIVVSHQLTPALLLAAVGGLLVVRRVPLWVPVAMVAIEAAWLALGWTYLSAHFGLVNAPDVKTPTTMALGHPELGVTLAAYGSRLVVATFAVLTVVGVVRGLRRGRVDLSALALIIAPCLVVPLQAYGGEGIFRAYIFALPWMAVIGGRVLLSARRPSWRALTVGAAAAVIGTGFFFAYFGLERANYMSPDDVATSTYYEHHLAGPDTQAIMIASNFPGPLTGDYVTAHIAPAASFDVVMADYPPFRELRKGTDGAAMLAQVASSSTRKHVYVVLAGSERRYAQLYGLYAPQFVPQLEHALATSRWSQYFRPVYRTSDSVIYAYVGPRVGQTG